MPSILCITLIYLMRVFLFVTLPVVILLALYFAFNAIVYDDRIIVVNPAMPRGVIDAKIVDSVIFDVDSLTVPFDVNYYQFVESDSERALLFLNENLQTIYRYDFGSRRLEQFISLREFGYSKQDRVQAFNLVNEDTLLIYNYNKTEIALVDRNKGKLIRRSLADYSKKRVDRVYPHASTVAPIAFDRSSQQIFMTGFLSDEFGAYTLDKSRKVFTSLSLENGQIHSDVNYPSFYWGSNWGGSSGFRRIFFCHNPFERFILLSFMADHYVTAYDLKTKNIKKVLCSSSLIDTIASTGYDQWYFEFMPKGKNFEYYLTTPSYGPIIYDRFRKVYYRIAEQPQDAKHPTNNKLKSIIVLSNEFDRIGEYRLPSEELDTFNLVITRNGILIRRKESRDDRLCFLVFNI